MARKKKRPKSRSTKRTLLKEPTKLFRDLLAEVNRTKADLAERFYKVQQRGKPDSGYILAAQLNADAALRKYNNEIKYYKESIKLVREFYPGYGVQQGVQLGTRSIVRISANKLRAIKSLAADLRARLATPNVKVRAKAKKSRQILSKHTHQKDRGQRRYIIPVEDSGISKAKIVKGRVQITRRLPKGEVTERYYYLPRRATRFDYETEQDYEDRDEDSPDDEDLEFMRRHSVVGMTEDLLPEMPKGWYAIINTQSGWIGAPSRRDLILSDLRSNWSKYDPVGVDETGGVASTIVGYKWIASTPDKALKKITERTTKRELFRQNEAKRARQKKARSRAISRHKKDNRKMNREQLEVHVATELARKGLCPANGKHISSLSRAACPFCNPPKRIAGK